MKLVDKTQEHHLPEDLEERQPWYEKRARKIASQIFSRKGLTVVLGIALALLLSLFLSLSFLSSSRHINQSGISISDVYADRTLEVVDQAETDRKIEHVRQNVPLIYKDQLPINQSILKNIAKTVDELGDVMVDPRRPADQKKQVFENMLGTTPIAKATFTQLRSHPTNDAYWKSIYAHADQVAQSILKKGLNQLDYLDKREAIIREHIPQFTLSRQDSALVFLVLNQTLQPNLILDEEAMTKERDRAAALVDPVIRLFQEGEIIVEQGKPVTPVQLAALEQMGKAGAGNNWLAAIGVVVLCGVFTATLWGYLYSFRNGAYFRPSYVAMLFTLILITVLAFRFVRNYNDLPLYFFPLGALTLIVTIFTHHRIGILATSMVVFLLGLILKTDFTVLSVLFFGSLMGTYIVSRRINFNDRGHLMFAGVYVSLINALGIIAITFMDPAFDLMSQLAWKNLAITIGWGAVGGVLSGMLTIGALPFLETMFQLVSPYTLMELSNHDHPLLRRMQFEAPGTFHHSLMVSSLAEAASEAIGANALLTRVGCLYHDIGKMKRPLFFIENQAYFGSENPHDKLTPRLSKLVITAHPRDSLEMARHYRLPEIIQSFMTEHHGTLMAGYFYNKACQEEGVENVNKSHFRYAGPKPQTRETAVVMLADACESATRAMKNPTVQQIEERIDKIIAQRVEDGQFDNCPITFRDIALIRETFLRVLRGIQHNRIEYQQNIMRDLGRKVSGKPATPSDKEVNQIVWELKKAEHMGAQQAVAEEPEGPSCC